MSYITDDGYIFPPEQQTGDHMSNQMTATRNRSTAQIKITFRTEDSTETPCKLCTRAKKRQR